MPATLTHRNPRSTALVSRARWLAASAILALMSACGGGDAGNDQPDPGSGTPPPVSPAQGFSLVPSRLGLASDGQAILLAVSAAGTVTWSSSDTMVATVDAGGHVQALSKGSAVISASSGADVATSALTVYNTGGSSPDPDTDSLIAQALSQNRINAEQALTYRVFALFNDERLPAEFSGPPPEGPNHGLLRELATTVHTLSPATQDLLLPFLLPPIYGQSWFAQRLGLTATTAQAAGATSKHRLSPTVNCSAALAPSLYERVSTAHFNVIYIKFGGADLDAGSARMISLIASFIEDVYGAEAGLLKREALDDSKEACSGGDGKIDIYYGPFGPSFGIAGWTTSYTLAPDHITDNACANRPSYITLNKMSSEFLAVERSLKDGEPLAKSLLAHELMHVLQFAMNRKASCTDAEWFDEATAQWAMDFVVPTIAQGLPGEFGVEDGLTRVASNYAKSGSVLADYLYAGHMVSMEKPGFNPKLNGYSDYLFFQFLARKQGPDKIKQIFDAMAAGKNSVEAIGAAVDMTTAWGEFAKTLWIGFDEKVLDYWATEDEYRFGLAGVYAQVPTTKDIIPQALKDKLKTTELDQKGEKAVDFELLKNALEADGYVIHPRSMFYEHLKFSDATVHTATFFNPIAGNPDIAFMKVQAVVKMGGEWKPPEDWTNEAFKTWCLDKKDERIEELILIVSNGEANRATEKPFAIYWGAPMRLSTTNVGCWRWKGTSSLTTTTPEGLVTVERASVTFDRYEGLGQPDAGMSLGYVVMKVSETGTVNYNIDGPLGGGCSVSGSGGAPNLVGDSSGIIVNFGLPEPLDRVVIGTGTTEIPDATSAITCTGPPEKVTSSASVHWLSLPDANNARVSDDGQHFVGTWDRYDDSGHKVSAWDFQAIREE